MKDSSQRSPLVMYVKFVKCSKIKSVWGIDVLNNS